MVPDFGSVKFLLSISSMDYLNSVIDISARQISILRKSFVFKSSFHNRVKAHDTIIIAIKSMLPKQLRNGDFIGKPFRPFSNYLPLNFMLQFKKGKSYLKIANPTSHAITIKANTSLGSVSFELTRDLSQSANTITHIHQDMNDSCAMCCLNISACPITQPMGSEPDKAPHSKHHTSHSYTIQSYDFPTCAESKHICMSNSDNYSMSKDRNTEFNENQHEKMMKHYHKYNQDKMTAQQIRELKCKTFPYLSKDDVRLNMSSVKNWILTRIQSYLAQTNNQLEICFTLCENVCLLMTFQVSKINHMFH